MVHDNAFLLFRCFANHQKSELLCLLNTLLQNRKWGANLPPAFSFSNVVIMACSIRYRSPCSIHLLSEKNQHSHYSSPPQKAFLSSHLMTQWEKQNRRCMIIFSLDVFGTKISRMLFRELCVPLISKTQSSQSTLSPCKNTSTIRQKTCLRLIGPFYPSSTLLLWPNVRFLAAAMMSLSVND